MEKNVPYEKWSRASFKLAYEEADGLRKQAIAERDEARRALVETQAQAEALAERAEDIAALTWFVRLVRQMNIPDHIGLAAVFHDLQGNRTVACQISIVDLRRCATAIDRLGVCR